MQEQTIKEKLKERYGKIALTGNSDSCCAPTDICSSHGMTSNVQMAEKIEYDAKELESVPQSSILGVGCDAPVNFAQGRTNIGWMVGSHISFAVSLIALCTILAIYSSMPRIFGYFCTMT